MLYWSVVFLVVSLVAAMFGFGDIAGSAATVARALFVVFLAAFAVSGLLSLRRDR
jgi:uncharacterized membrane protein YtjA (UPF0391 family)